MSDIPLLPLPGTNIIYFEINLIEISSSILIGFTNILPRRFPNFNKKGSINFQTKNLLLFVYENSINLSNFLITNGSIIGIGIDIEFGNIFLTINGDIIETTMKLNEISNTFYPYFGISSKSDEIFINIGQNNFKYNNLIPPNGWCLYNFTLNKQFQRGPENYAHIYGYYRDIGISNNFIDTLIDVFPHNQIELTFSRITKNKNISIGFGNNNYPNNKSIGMLQNSFGINCSSGKLYLNGYGQGSSLFNSNELKLNDTIGLIKIDSNFSFTFNEKNFILNNINDINFQYPIITIQTGLLHFFINTGFFPFYNNNNDEKGDILLFNNIYINNSSNKLLKPFGLYINDIVESRDRLFYGKVIGFYKDRPLFNVPGIKGAISLDSSDPIYHKLLLRIVYRPKKKNYYIPIIILNSFKFVNIGNQNLIQPGNIFIEKNCSIFVGIDINNNLIHRPIFDLINSKNCEIQNNLINLNNINPLYFLYNYQFQLFDILLLLDNNILVIVTIKNNEIKFFNGKEFISINNNYLLLFRFFGYDNGNEFSNQMIYNVCISSFIKGSIFHFSNFIEGVFGNHIIFNKSNFFSNIPLNLSNDLPPYVLKLLLLLINFDYNENLIENINLPILNNILNCYK